MSDNLIPRVARRVVIASLHDYSLPSAVTNRYLTLARSLQAVGTEVLVLSPESGLKGNVQAQHPDLKWVSTGSAVGEGKSKDLRLRNWRKMPSQLGRVDAVILISVDPIFIQRVLILASKIRAVVIHELTEYPDIVLPSNIYGRVGMKLFEAKFLKQFSGAAVITTCLEQYVSNFVAPGTPVDRIPILVDTDVWKPNPVSVRRKRTDQFSIGYAGSLSNKKDGVDQLIRAVARLVRARSTEAIVHLNLWGIGGDEESLRNLVRVLGVESHVTFHGLASVDHLSRMLPMQSCLVHARPYSRQAEAGFATKVGEFLATGRPVISTITGDIENYLVNRKSAFLVPSNDLDALFSTIEFVMAEPEIGEKVGIEGRRVAVERFSSDVAAQKFLTLIGRSK